MTMSAALGTASTPSVPAGIAKLRERLQQEARERAVLESALRRLVERAGLTSDTTVIDHDLAAPDGQAQPRREVDDDAPRAPAAVFGAFWSRRAAASLPALVPTPGRACYAARNRATKVVGIVAVGRNRDQLAELLATVARKQVDRPDFTPIFFTDSTAFDLFREHGFVFEYLPAEELRTRGAAAWEEYAAVRLSHARATWGITGMIEASAEERIEDRATSETAAVAA